MTTLEKTFRKTNKFVPIWFMRQAGRYLPEYMEIRRNVTDFLELCYDSKKASIITMQPIERFDLDAAIIFSDILILPHTIGWNVKFQKGEGPILQKFEREKDLKILNNKFDPQINHVYDMITNVRATLSKKKSLIGFVGSPWTVATYMLEGMGKQDFSVSKNFIYNKPKLAKALINAITDRTIEHLLNQIASGVDVVQLFDSWSGILSENEYDQFVIEPTEKIIHSIKNKYSEVPIIGFPRGSGYLYENYIKKTKIDGISVDQFVPIEIMKKWQSNILVQGNLDPVCLLSSKEVIEQKAHNILSNLGDKNFIFNLGHGILQNTPVENVQFLVDYVRNYKK